MRGLVISGSLTHDDEEGDCFRCCLAAILNLPASHVPNFAELYKGKDSWHDEVDDWLRQFGLAQACMVMGPETPAEMVPVYLNNVSPNVPAIVSGVTETGSHSVVAWNERYHNPAPSRPLVGPIPEANGGAGGWWVTYIAAAPNFKIGYGEITDAQVRSGTSTDYRVDLGFGRDPVLR